MTAILQAIDEDNLETKLYEMEDGRFGVRLRDLDAGENVGIHIFSDYADAAAFFNSLI